MHRTFYLAAAAVLATVFTVSGLLTTLSRADDHDSHVVYTPNVARDSIGSSYLELILEGECIETAGRTYEIVGYEIQSTPSTFFYAHAFAIQQNEPFTHTGVLSTYLDIPPGTSLYGGWTQGWDAPIVDGRADVVTRLPGVPGPFSFEVIPGPNQLVQGSPFVFNAPGECVPLDLNSFVPPVHGLHFPLEGDAGLAVTGGTCLGYTTILEITINPDGTLTYFQPDTLDLNTGVLWPAPGGGYEFLVTNQQHAEAYAGTISPDFTHITGKTVWNNACRWTFDAIVTY